MKLSFDVDQGAGSKAALGLIVLQSDESMEAELRSVFDQPGLALYHSRITSAPEVTPETLAQMELDLPVAAALLPTAQPLDVVGYGCTSGATVIGADKISAIIRAAQPTSKTTDPISAVMAASRHLGVKRIGFVTPYVADVSEAMRALLEQNGLEVAAFGSFEQIEESVVSCITEQSVLEAVCAVGENEDVEAVFASCTNLRSFGIIDEAEKKLGKPIISSNQALAWHMLTLAGLPTAGHGPGRLFQS